MSTESMPQVNSEKPNEQSALETFDPTTVVTPTAEQVRKNVHPEHKESFIERTLDTPAKKWGAAVTVSVVALGGPAAAAYEISANATHEQPAPTSHAAGDILPTTQPSASAGALDIPSASPSPANTAPLESAPVLSPAEKIKKSLEIPVGLAPLELSQKLAADLSVWEMAGANRDLIANWDVHMTIEQYTAKIAADQANTYKTAIFGDTTDPAILAFVKKITNENAANLQAYMTTAGSSDPENVESFTTATKIASLVNSSEKDGVVSVTANSYGENNGDKNNIARLNHLPTKIPSVMRASFAPQSNKTMQVTSISFGPQ